MKYKLIHITQHIATTHEYSDSLEMLRDYFDILLHGKNTSSLKAFKRLKNGLYKDTTIKINKLIGDMK